MGQREFRQHVRRLRTARGLSQEALAMRARVTREYIARLEAGLHDPQLSTLKRLARALRVSAAELIR